MKLLSSWVLLLSLAGARELNPDTIDAWEGYVEATERRVEAELESDAGFLVLDFMEPRERSECENELDRGRVCTLELATFDAEGKRITVPDGMAHHWYGSVFVPGASLEDVLSWVQDYGEHERFFDEVEASRLLSRDGDTYEIFLRLKRTKVISVHYNTEHLVTYRFHGDGKASSRSVATRIRELDSPGRDSEREKEPGEDSGYLWGLNSYWRFEETEKGILVECESISLSRSIPAAVRWLVVNYLSSVPRESLEATLAPLRENLARDPNASDSPKPFR